MSGDIEVMSDTSRGAITLSVRFPVITGVRVGFPQDEKSKSSEAEGHTTSNRGAQFRHAEVLPRDQQLTGNAVLLSIY